MDRRELLRGGAVAGVASVVAGSLGGVSAAALERAHSTRILEGHDYAGSGRGSLRVVWSVATTARAVAVTFDDGPHARLTPRVLDMLAEHQVRATFFLIGSAAERHPELVRRAVDEGHEIGNHTWSHPHMATLEPADQREEVIKGAEALTRLIGHRPRWFRSPRGMLTGEILRAAADLSHDVAMWSARTPVRVLDRSTYQVTEHLLNALHPGAIYDLHDGTSGREGDRGLERRRDSELPAYPPFLASALGHGYRFLTVSELVDTSPPP